MIKIFLNLIFEFTRKYFVPTALEKTSMSSTDI
jgi:hypothetical protein